MQPRPRPAELRRSRWRTWGRVLVLVGLLAVACAPSVPPTNDFRPLPQAGLRLDGALSGPLPGLGPRVDLDLWMRADQAVRADLRMEGEEGPRHEILLWTPQVAWLYDRRRLRYAELGPRPGTLEALGGRFRVEELWWVLFARGEERWLPQVEWTNEGDEIRGSAPKRGYRRPQGPRPAWSELLWLDAEDEVHHLRAEYLGWQESPLGPVPTRMAWEGSDLEGRVSLEWTVQGFSALGDTIFDPLWEPEGL